MKSHLFHQAPFMPSLFSQASILYKTIPKVLVLCIVCFLASSKLTATAGNPCDCTSFTNVGTPGQTTYLGTQSLSGCVRMMGTIVINQTTTWNGLSIRMVEGSLIRVESQLNMYNSFLSGCTYLWQGIRVVENAGINMTGNIIKDACRLTQLRT